MSRETTRLVDALRTALVRISVLVRQLQDGSATTDQQRQTADRLEELVETLQSHAADVDAGVLVPYDLLAERHSA